MPIDENTLSPFQIGDAREAAHAASEFQRALEDQLRTLWRDYAKAEKRYRVAVAVTMLRLAAGDEKTGAKPVAQTVAKDLARGDENVANLRHEERIAWGMVQAAEQQAFRYGADRRDLAALIDWSMRRDLRTDTPPAPEQPTTGGRP